MRVDLLGLPVDLLGRDETLARALAAMAGEAPPLRHAALDVATLVAARRDAALARDLRESDLVSVAGSGIALALWLAGRGARPRVAGIDLFDGVLEGCERRGLRPFLLGEAPDVVADAARALRRRHPRLRLAGRHHGHFRPDQEPEICRRIAASGADGLVLSLPAGLRHGFLRRNRERLAVPLVLSAEGAFALTAGRMHRAPPLVRRVGAEWAYRAAQDPRRLAGRALRSNAAFAGLLLAALLRRLADPRLPAGSGLRA
ncbi:glycosyl transferase, WecB/TagA/CpsF family [Methylobacterium sp. 4-46]|uniref:WecB/TagA/CpsF family glycosyltransferase n=1 Tax=unclassified Methylobacterium TaxID=2615210 RepID=UPI000165C7F8|nr:MULTISPECIES: WecB/TagA/CpsF family glycosyltransferase [Methylobacterium]ACA17795.1 glycosyl transferase, WecB/TagA/CpsF family [Methylobacterium sp. 4-46]WFT83463.1 WecB/TagA/CpsF family glycosyltransferase [Methylobacterium nodulans]